MEAGNVAGFCFLAQPATQTRMKSCHAAALALVGWYLMVPPPGYPPSGSEGIRHWQILSSFDSARECEAERASVKRSAADSAAKSETSEPGLQSRLFAVCIATDDPGLEEGPGRHHPPPPPH
jgi:hypothetical protein